MLAKDVHFYDSWMENYVQTYVQRDIRGLFPRLDLVRYQRFVSMLTALSGTIMNRSQIGRSFITNWRYYYFRTKNGAEIDMVLEGPFGILPIEIKFGSTVKLRQLQSLKAFVYKNDLPLGIVINNDDDIRLLADRIVQVPTTFI